MRLTTRIGCLVVLLLAGLLLYAAAAPFGRRMTRLAKLVWFKGGLLVLNVGVVEIGRPFLACPTLLVANHVSWLDILVLGEAVDATFVAKSEVSGWPILGWLARLTGTMFVKRHWRFAREQCTELAERLRAGHDIVLFPEGTSTDGLAVAKFKSTLFAAAGSKILDRPVAVQPVTLAYTALADGTPIAPAHADRYAWYGDASFAPHFMRALCDGGCRIDLVFHRPTLSWEVQDRKVLARHAAATIAGELSLRHAQAAAAFADRPLPAADEAVCLADRLANDATVEHPA